MESTCPKLKDLLRTILHLDRTDLDFGMYRIMGRTGEKALGFLEEELPVETGDDEVFNDLLTFFQRHCQGGEYRSTRRFKEGTYMLPGEEEVKLYFAHHDQYYVKASERHESYAFRLPDGKAVRFLVSEGDQERGTRRKRARERRYVLREKEPLEVAGDSCLVFFDYRVLEERRKQADLNGRTVETLMNGPLGEILFQSLLEEHVNRFTSGNTSDYFIHKDLGGFLRRELDFYVKNEVLSIEEIDEENLARARKVRDLGQRIIELLEEQENLQKRMWLKKKFVLETQYVLTLDRVPDRFYPEIAANEAQREEWVQLFRIDVPLTADFLKANPHLVVDTAHFPPRFKQELLEGFDDLEGEVQGLLIQGDNFHALNLMQAGFKGRIRSVYIDPPFNTEGDGFLYKDRYRHSSWLALMNDRLHLAVPLLSQDGNFFVHIDYNEKERLRLLMDSHLTYITEIIWRIGWLSGFKTKANKFIRNHDTIYQFAKQRNPFFVKSYIPYPEGYRRRDGKPPKGAGYPLEDTWNCSEIDKLHSIQIMSFSREKAGDDQLTQKNEQLLERMIKTTTLKGDWVMDYFLGSGTTTAVAQKMGRRWVGVELGEQFFGYALPRMKRVLFGDRYGISEACGWPKGGMFKYIRLESYEDSLSNIAADGPYLMGGKGRDACLRLDPDAFRDPFCFALRVPRAGTGEAEPQNVDLKETFNMLLGLTLKRTRREEGLCAMLGTDPEGGKILVLWRDCSTWPDEAIEKHLRESTIKREYGAFDRVYVNGPSVLKRLQKIDGIRRVCSIEEEFQHRMFEEDVFISAPPS